MTIRHPLRLAAVATLTALAGFGAQAIEADRWEARADARMAGTPNTDATREPLAWAVSRNEATEFQDAVSRDSMASRDEVRQQLAAAHAHGLTVRTGEAGATDDVWHLRDRFAAARQDLAMAHAAGDPATDAAQAAGDPIAEMAAATSGVPSAEPGGSMYGLAPDGTQLRLPESQAADTSADISTAMLSDARTVDVQ